MRLNKKKAAAAAQATSTFEMLDDGVYEARLVSVELKEGAKGPYWSWRYKVTEPGAPGRALWNNTSLTDDSLWKLKETFDAFGVPTDTDTDELEGESVRLVVGHRTIQQGARKGEEDNQIEQVLPLLDEPAESADDDDEDDESVAEAAEEDDEEATDEDDDEPEPEPAPPPVRAAKTKASPAGRTGTATRAKARTAPDDIPF